MGCGIFNKLRMNWLGLKSNVIKCISKEKYWIDVGDIWKSEIRRIQDCIIEEKWK